VVDRERERIAFNEADYWGLVGEFSVLNPRTEGDPKQF